MNTSSPDPVQPPSSLFDAIPDIASRLTNESLLVTVAYLLIVVAIGVFAPSVVTLLGRGFFILIVILAFVAYLAVRVLAVYERLRQQEEVPRPQETPQRPVGPSDDEEPEDTPRPVSDEDLRDRYLRELVNRCARLKMTTIDINAISHV
jgi:hypothetical protein